ncbi:hypothetical protein GWK47_016192 [Chionoecetes opilio]|uniref:Uncharacterized protein n=1 Tax=Chionoecetes opilio TaxID=41210 RepID=A0A8J4XUM5_CHIOP|nr:hypothetical protein GWK47_016192 [Chionoecetes opilio]
MADRTKLQATLHEWRARYEYEMLEDLDQRERDLTAAMERAAEAAIPGKVRSDGAWGIIFYQRHPCVAVTSSTDAVSADYDVTGHSPPSFVTRRQGFLATCEARSLWSGKRADVTLTELACDDAPPGIHCTLEDVECGGLVHVSLSHYTVPQPAVSRQEGAEESFCPGEGNNDLLVPLVGVPGGVWVRCRPRLPECSEVRGALLEDFVRDAQAGHVSPVL